MSYEELARALTGGATPYGVELIKRNPVRCVARAGDAVVKVFLRRPERARREARALHEARSRDVPVPELLDAGEDWLATRYLRGREAGREDLDALLPLVERMHERGMLHGDLHLGNVWMSDAGPVLLDIQRARFLPFVPGWLRRRELGYLAFSAGDPLPPPLRHVRFWRDLRARRHWRSRTRRCLLESSVFTAFDSGFRRRASDPRDLRAALGDVQRSEPLKSTSGTRLYRSGPWILKEHASGRRARAAWIAAQGLEARGLSTGRALAWRGSWLVMEDAGPTLIDWVESDFEKADGSCRSELADALGDLLADLHRRGIYHADLKANNISWSPGEPPRLLDYGRVRFGRRVPLRRRVKNLAQLNAALPDLVPSGLRERALRRYLERSAFPGDAARLRSAVIEASLARRHRWTGC